MGFKRIQYEIFEQMKKLGIKKIMIPLSVECEYVSGIKWRLIEEIKDITSFCKRYDFELLFSFAPYNCDCSYDTNIAISKNTEAFCNFLKIADKFLPGDYYPSIEKFTPLFDENRDDYLIGEWTYNHDYFPVEYQPFPSEKLFKNNNLAAEEYWKLHPLSWERHL